MPILVPVVDRELMAWLTLKNLIFHPLDKYSYYAIFRPIPSRSRGVA